MSQQRAFIRAEDCIGCAKCLPVCPTDAIVGAAKFLHAVLEEDCIGCERCVPVCPVDCIVLLPMQDQYNPEILTSKEIERRSQYVRNLTQARKARLQKDSVQKQEGFLLGKKALQQETEDEGAARRAYLQRLLQKK